MNKKEIMQVLEAIIEKDNADGCVGCAFIDTEDWELPCAKCKRACKDYWRSSEYYEVD